MMNSNKNHLGPISISLYLSFFLLHLNSATENSPYIPTDKIFLNCGGPSEATDPDERLWSSDIGSKFLSSEKNTLASSASAQETQVPQVPYISARIFFSECTYSFPVRPGRKFVRLYFYPSSYGSYNASNAFLSVSLNTSNMYTLLRNFSASQTTEVLKTHFIVKEFSVNVQSGRLNITFKPSSNTSNAYAFVNGIEVVSMPDIYNTVDGHAHIVGLGQPTQFYINNGTALENVFRLNVGGNVISPKYDTGMFRSWFDDSQYIFGVVNAFTPFSSSNMEIKYPPSVPTYVAPKNVYATARSMGPDTHANLNYNLTWSFSIDPGFYYLMRLHFCEVELNITGPNQRVFKIFINNQTVEDMADVVVWAGGHGIPVYKDYVVSIPPGKAQQDIWLALHPNTASKPMYYDAILNGAEIFKISDSNGNLAGPNPIPAVKPEFSSPPLTKSPSSGNLKNRATIIAGGIVGGVAVVFLLCFIVFLLSQPRRQRKDSGGSTGPHGWFPLSLYGNSHSAGSAKTNTTGSYTSSLPSNLCRNFSFLEIKAATNDFDEALVLGVGGFGKVYKGEIDGGTTKVAIKRGNQLSDQGVHEFLTEINILSRLRHRHLVSLIGYCKENCEMILVYDYMSQGTLREHLYKTHKSPLPWKHRLQICIGAARGLHYLHTGGKYSIIHRDMKTTNILLDDKWVAKVSDFGLSKMGPAFDHTHVSTVVKGTHGYLDPEYYRRQQLTEKSDVYSFGVVLFEVLCARPALCTTLAREQVNLADWALQCQKRGILYQIIDPYLKGKIASESLKKFAETAEKCVADHGIDRPTMGDVLWSLEFALQLQESVEDSGGTDGNETAEETPFRGKYERNTNSDVLLGLHGIEIDSTTIETSISNGGQSLGSQDSDGLTNVVFSQIMNREGR